MASAFCKRLTQYFAATGKRLRKMPVDNATLKRPA
jgi:hypothetical protein